MKIFNLLYVLLPSIITVTFAANIPSDCIILHKIYDHFKLDETGLTVDNVIQNCCSYESRRNHSSDGYATTEWECQSDLDDPNNHITSIILNEKDLSGEIPWDLLKELNYLQILYLNDNKLTGDISNFSGFNSLKRLNLSNNRLTGTLPSNISHDLQLINVYNNDIKGFLPQSWATRENFQCFVPSGVCKPTTLTTYVTLCNNTPNTDPIHECTKEQMETYEKMAKAEESTTGSTTGSNTNDNDNMVDNSSSNDKKSNINSNGKDNDNIPNEEEVVEEVYINDEFSEGSKKTSAAVVYTFISIIVLLVVVVTLVACIAKYKNVKHDKHMRETLLKNRSQILKQFDSDEAESFFAAHSRSMDHENDSYSLSKYSESTSFSGSHFSGSEAGSHVINRASPSKNFNMNHINYTSTLGSTSNRDLISNMVNIANISNISNRDPADNTGNTSNMSNMSKIYSTPYENEYSVLMRIFNDSNKDNGKTQEQLYQTNTHTNHNNVDESNYRNIQDEISLSDISKPMDLTQTDISSSYSLPSDTKPGRSYGGYDSTYYSNPYNTYDYSLSTPSVTDQNSNFTTGDEDSISLIPSNSNMMISASVTMASNNNNNNIINNNIDYNFGSIAPQQPIPSNSGREEDLRRNPTQESYGSSNYDAKTTKTYLTKRSMTSNVSGNTLINHNNSNSNNPIATILNSTKNTSGNSNISYSMMSSSPTATITTSKFMEEDPDLDHDRGKIVLRGISEEEDNSVLTEQRMDLDKRKGLNLSYLYDNDSPFLSDSQQQKSSFHL